MDRERNSKMQRDVIIIYFFLLRPLSLGGSNRFFIFLKKKRKRKRKRKTRGDQPEIQTSPQGKKGKKSGFFLNFCGLINEFLENNDK